ncbi:MAG: fibronectin type III domain-containing protein [Bacteroidales bacterium]|nr:fibronectin type III domain-containing protein [Bacteroidales bacterium]
MKNIKLNISLAFLILLVGLLTTCQKREFSNPWDELAQLKPEAWAPEQLQVQSQHIALNTLSWEFDDKNIQGFRIDRRVGEEDWQEAYASMPKDSRVWLDSLVVPDTTINYQYRLYAYAGNNKSAQIESSYRPVFEAPTNLQLEKLNDISFELHWQNTTQWPEIPQLAQGFKIDRKTAEGEWELAVATLPSNQTGWVDTNVFVGREAIELNYRVYAYYGDLKSAPLQASKETSLTTPSELIVAKNSLTSVTLSWQNNNQGAQGFILERSYDAQSWQQLQKNTLTSYTDEDFELNRQVYYRLAAYYGDYLSDYDSSSFEAQLPVVESFIFRHPQGSSPISDNLHCVLVVLQ